MSCWYESFKRFVDSGECTYLREGFDVEHPHWIKPTLFYPCLWEFLDDDAGSRFESDIRLSDEEL